MRQSRGGPTKRGDTLGLRTVEKISAVEGVRLSEEMRRDFERASDATLSPAERARFVMDLYGEM